MTEKELRKLNRYQLLELLIMQTERAEDLQKKLEQAEAELHDTSIRLTALGSIAEASLQLGGVFDAAQRAADLYINAAMKKAEEIEAEARQKAAAILADAEEQSRRILANEERSTQDNEEKQQETGL